MSETSEIVGPAIKAISQLPNCFVLRLNTGKRGGVSYGRKGLPDILVIKSGVVAFIEAKASAKSKLSKDQELIKALIEYAGAKWFRANSYDEAMDFVKTI